MGWIRKIGLSAGVACLVAFIVPASAAPNFREEGQDQGGAPASQGKQKPKANTDNATVNAPDQPKWDPLRAEKDLEVGQYYMKKSDYDAAIDRFNDAIESKPGYAAPFRFLGEAQEKKGQKKKAVKSYRRYLDLAPRADDADKVRKKIEKLEKEVERDERKESER